MFGRSCHACLPGVAVARDGRPVGEEVAVVGVLVGGSSHGEARELGPCGSLGGNARLLSVSFFHRVDVGVLTGSGTGAARTTAAVETRAETMNFMTGKGMRMEAERDNES